jgi:hypothetical protein
VECAAGTAGVEDGGAGTVVATDGVFVIAVAGAGRVG